MAGTGLGLFLPSEAAYKYPGAYAEALAAEGNKEAKYLASMDQFYAELEEMQRQFDVTAKQKEHFFEETMAWEKEKLSETLDWEKEKLGETLDFERWAKGKEIGLSERQLSSEQAYREKQLGLEEEKLDMIRRQNEFYKGLYLSEEQRKQETHDYARRGIEDLYSGGGVSGIGGSENYGGYVSPTSALPNVGDIYGGRTEGGTLTFSDSPVRTEGEFDWSKIY